MLPEQACARGVNTILYDSLIRGEKGFGTLVARIRNAQPDVVYFGGLYSEAGYLLRQLRDQGSTAWFISGAGIVSEGFVMAAGDARFLTKVLMTFGADPRNPKTYPTSTPLVARFRQQGYEPEGYTLYAYTTVQVIAAALQANSPQAGGAALGAWIKRNSILTAMGVKRFDRKGDLTVSDYVMYRWKADATYSEL